ncbi:MAG: sodium-dependent transporter [Bacteroidetes bacterium]|nr:sodium-dependent transporter [Bacteroidota bacterium]
MDNKQNEIGFSSKIGFLAAAASSAVGVGNIWRFPYLTGKYGGASFVLLYIVSVFILGIPLVLAKLAFGRKMKAGTFKAYSSYKPKIWRLLGFGSAFTSFIMLSYYIVITGWFFGYFFKIINKEIFQNIDLAVNFSNFTSNVTLNIFYTLFAIFIIALIVRKEINEGIEKISKILMPLFLLLLISLIIYCFTLKNSGKGLRFYLLPNLKYINLEAFHAALTQAFLSLSIGLGISITYGAYVNKKDDLIKSTLIIALSDTIISLLAGLIIFPLIFQAELEPNQGASLIFISLPFAFKSLGVLIGWILGIFFFLLLIFAAITSAIALLEVPTKFVIEKFKISRQKTVIILCTLLFALSIPSILSNGGNKFFTKFWFNNNTYFSFLDTMDLLSADIIAPLIALFFSFFISKKFKIENLLKEIRTKEQKNNLLELYLKITIKFICPIVIGLLLILKIASIFFGKNIFF